MFLNMIHTDGPLAPEQLLERAVVMRGRVFIGIELDRHEAKHVRTFLHDGCCEVAASIAGARQR